MNLILFILTCFGLTQILCSGRIFDKIRPKHYFFSCPMCVGWHSGLIIWFLSSYMKLTELFSFDDNWLTGFLLACLSSGTSYILCQIVDDKGIKIHG